MRERDENQEAASFAATLGVKPQTDFADVGQLLTSWPDAVAAAPAAPAGLDDEFNKAVCRYASAQTYLFAESDPPAPHRLAEFEAAGRALVTTRAHTPGNISFKLHEVLLSRTKADGDAMAMARQIVKGTGCDSDLGDGDDRLVASALLDLELINARKAACEALNMPSIHDADWPAAVAPVSLMALAESGADLELVKVGERHAKLDAESLAHVDNHRGAPDAEYVRTNKSFTAELTSAFDQSLKLRATTVAGLRAKALIASAWMPGEGTEEFDSVEWRAVWSLVNDLLALGAPSVAA